MILHHIPHDSHPVVIASSMFNINGLHGRYLYMIDIVPVPDGLEYCIGKPKHQNILNGLFCQVMIDSEYLMFLKILMN